MSAAQNRTVELSSNELLELKLLKDHLAARLEEAKRGTLVVVDRMPMRVGSDEIRNLEKWIATIQRILLKAVKP